MKTILETIAIAIIGVLLWTHFGNEIAHTITDNLQSVADAMQLATQR
jgi:hypothetical protein